MSSRRVNHNCDVYCLGSINQMQKSLQNKHQSAM